MAFDIIRTADVRKENDKFIIQYKVFDNEDETIAPKSFQIDGKDKGELKEKLEYQINKYKSIYKMREQLNVLGDEIVGELKGNGII